MIKVINFLVLLLLITSANAQLSSSSFSSGNLVVGRFVTTGVYATAGVARKFNLLEMSSSGTVVQNMDIPFTGTNAITMDNTSTNGNITLAGNGQFISLIGFNVDDNGTNTIITTDAATTRIVGRISANTTFAAYKLANSSAGSGSTDPLDGTNIRNAYTTDGNKFYVSGGSTSTGVTTTTGGVWYFHTSDPVGSSTQITTTHNTRWVIAQDNTLYSANAAIGSPINLTAGLQRIGAGTSIPETAQSSTNLTPALTGTPTGAFISPDGLTAYIGKNSSTAIEKWKNNAGTWSLQYTIAIAGSARSLCVKFNGNAVELYSIYSKNVVKSTDDLTSITWAGANTIIYTEADTNVDLRGIAFTPGTTNTGVLPVNLGNVFALKGNNNVTIGWETLSESAGVQNFEIQKSNDVQNFVTIATIAATKNSNKKLSYSYIDNAVNTTTVYYRVAVNNVDAPKQISKIVMVKYSGIKPFTLINPVKERLVISFSQKMNGNIVVTDMNGRIIANKMLNNVEGMVLLPLPAACKGFHVVTVVNGLQKVSEKIFIQ